MDECSISYPSDKRPGRRKYSNLLPLVVELDSVEMPHYLVVDLGEEVSAIKFRSTNTNRANDSSWKTINLYTSDSYNPARMV